MTSNAINHRPTIDASTPSPYNLTNLAFDFNQSLNLTNASDLDNCNTVMPEIAARSTDITVQMGRSVVLSCCFRNTNGARPIWRKVEPECIIIASKLPKYHCTMSSDGEARLQINGTDLMDSGIYVCAISNPNGIVQCSIGLTVTDSNHSNVDDNNMVATDVCVEVLNPTSVRVCWDFATSATNSYVIEYCRAGSLKWTYNDDKPVRSRYILTGLIPGECYTFRLVCPNTNLTSMASHPVTMPLSDLHMRQQQQFNNRYLSLGELGRGRFSIVRLASDAVTGQRVVLKQIYRKYQDLITTQEEYKLLATAQHPNIVHGLALFENAPMQSVDTVVMEL